jgi:Flp pilus assembly protein CpaB
VGRRTIVLIIAIILGGLAAWGIFAFLTNVEDDAREGLNEVAVFRATEFIDRGADGSLVIGNFIESTELEEFVPENAITSDAQLRDVLTNRIARGPISNGQIVTTDLWADRTEEVASLSQLIAPGMQAIVVRPDEVRAAGGFVRAGDHVNIISSADLDRAATIALLKNPIGRELLGVADIFDDFVDLLPPEIEAAEVEQILDEVADAIPATVAITFHALQDVEVLAIGSVARGGPSAEEVAGEDGTPIEGVEAVGSQLVTLEVSPEDAEKVVFIFDFLRPWFTLISSDGPYETFESNGTTIDEIIGDIIQERTLAILGGETS